ncbi:hypothetical protein [Streptomyces sp. NBC_01465]|uniref:hypothetical protein n=1 Tax=Streptomyces sp. NBC_01465 TaxID=2903878 RepID=UPI002E307778|nr:hypothetical protein [Streptomyces sp. NBC_01465]
MAHARSPRHLVFTDVDETLISAKSMLEILRLHLLLTHGDAGHAEYERARERFAAAYAR